MKTVTRVSITVSISKYRGLTHPAMNIDLLLPDEINRLTTNE